MICQHSHCIGCEEKYQNGTIVYGQGNFLFDLSEDICWQTSLLVKIEEDFTISYIPIVKVGNGVRLADGQKAKQIMSEFLFRSEEIKEPGFIEQNYKEFADSFLEYYLRALAGKRSVCFRVINKLSGGRFFKQYLKRTYLNANLVRISNYLDCEAHRELLSQALANKYSAR